MSEARHVELDAVAMTVTPTFEATGSILAGTAGHRLLDIDCALEITSPAPSEHIASLIAQAEQMCFVLDAIERPHEVRRRVNLNGVPLE